MNVSRREFLRSSAAAAAAAISSSAYAAGSDSIKVGMIGCGVRCTEAARNAMRADKGVRIAAIADLLIDRAQEARAALKTEFPEQVSASNDNCFAGFDAYKHVIESVDVVLIANAAKFHPLHMRAAIEAGKHVFVEKPHAIDPNGIKRVMAACELAKQKGLSVQSGLQSRYHPGYQETVKRIHDGAIGDIVAFEENFIRAPYGLHPRKPGETEMQFQGGNQYHFHWLSGDDVPQSLVHNLDRASWVMHNTAPVKCHGLAGRSTLKDEVYGDVFDHHSVVYEYANGVRVYAFCRTIPNCYNENSSVILGAKGRAFLLQGRIEGENKWRYDGPKANPYDIEHVAFFKAIRSGTPINAVDYMARSTLIGIMGQFSCYTGQEVTWDQISQSDFYFPPKPEDCRIDMEPPVKPGPDGSYPVFVPGITKLL
jgi:predicted dehydrogenase